MTISSGFTGTNGDPWDGNWTATSYVSSGSVTNINGNRGLLSPSTNGGYTDHVSQALTAAGSVLNGSMAGTVMIPNAGNELYGEVAFRADSTLGVSGYVLAFQPLSGNIQFYTRTGGATAVVGSSAAFTFTSNTIYGWRVQWEGTSLRAKIWSGSEPAGWSLSITDSTYAAAGSVGLLVENGFAAASNGDIYFDDFSFDLLADPTLTGHLARRVATLAPATHVDRRIVPQQRDRRDANTVATAANPLASPLFRPASASRVLVGQYPAAHVTFRPATAAQLAQRDRRNALTVATVANDLSGPLLQPFFSSLWEGAWLPRIEFGPQIAAEYAQRRLVSDPALTIPPNTDPLQAAAGRWRRQVVAATHYDRREYPRQLPLLGDLSLLASAQLEGVLLGQVDDVARHRTWYTDRRLYPRQLDLRGDLSLLTTAELENELLGGAETAKRYGVAATHAPRWWMPRQHPYIGVDLGTAQLDELLGSADTARHYLVAATHVDRRLVPQQRAYVSDPLLLTTAQLDELLGSADDLNRHRSWYTDRREFWDQRRTSDQSDAGPLDPTLSASGPRILAATVAAWDVDRREVPQQRAYVSDPLLLSTSLLEGVLLGSADDVARHRAWYGDRRWSTRPSSAPAAPDQPPYDLALRPEWSTVVLAPATHHAGPRSWLAHQPLRLILIAPVASRMAGGTSGPATAGSAAGPTSAGYITGSSAAGQVSGPSAGGSSAGAGMSGSIG